MTAFDRTSQPAGLDSETVEALEVETALLRELVSRCIQEYYAI